MARVIFTNPPWYLYEDKQHKHGVRERWPALGPGGAPHFKHMRGKMYLPYPFHLGYAAAHTRREGHEVIFYDAIADCSDMQTFTITVDAFEPEYIVINTSSPSIYIDLKTAKYFHDQGIKTILVGPHPSTFPKDIIEHDCVDYVCIGEYDLLVSDIVNKKQPPGIYGPRQPIDVDRLPFPILEGETATWYNDYFTFPDAFEKPQLQIWTSRGCPYQCSFCLWTHTMYGELHKGGQAYRLRSAENVLEEIDDRFGKYPFGNILFDDDTFGLVKKENAGDRGYDFLMALSEGLRDRNIQWACMTRIDAYSTDMWKRLQESGLVGCKVGIETFSYETAKLIKKGYKKSFPVVDRVKELLDMGIRFYASTMTHIAGESEDDRKATVSILDDLMNYAPGRFNYQRQFCTVYPGTPLYDDFKKQGFDMDGDYTMYDGGGHRMRDLVLSYNDQKGLAVIEDEPTHAEGHK